MQYIIDKQSHNLCKSPTSAYIIKECIGALRVGQLLVDILHLIVAFSLLLPDQLLLFQFNQNAMFLVANDSFSITSPLMALVS